MKRPRLIGCLLVLLLCALGAGYWFLTSSPPLLAEDVLEAAPSSASGAGRDGPETEEEKTRRRLLGVWYDKSQADRLLTMTLHEDGTGKLLVEISGLKTYIVGDRLHFDMKWSFSGQKLSTRMVGGEPADKVNLARKMQDTSGDDTILELSDERLLLLSKDGKTQYDWRRDAGAISDK